MTRNRVGIGIFLSFMVGLSTSTARAQEGVGRLEGRVLRADGTGVPGVSVVVNELSLTDITAANGLFTFASVPAGTYSITFALGENLVTRSGVAVTPPAAPISAPLR